VERVVRELSTVEDAVAGTPAGKEAEHLLSSILDEYGVEHSFVTVRVRSWRSHGGELVSPIFSHSMEAEVLPPFASVNVEGLAVAYRGPSGVYDDVIVLVGSGGSCTEIERVYTGLVSRSRPLLVVFLSPWRLRCPLSLRPLPPRPEEPAVPAVAVYGPRASRLLGEAPLLLRVEAEAQLRYSYARSIVAGGVFEGYYGDSPVFYIAAHFDHWLRGAHDNASGVAAALASYLRARGAAGQRVGLLLLNGGEFGEDTYWSLYWGSAARKLAELLSNIAEPKAIVFNIDTVSAEPISFLGSPLGGSALARASSGGLNDAAFDSMWLRGLGPALTVTSRSYRARMIRHTWLDSVESVDFDAVTSVARDAASAIGMLSRASIEPRAAEAARSIYESVSGLPLPLTLRESYRVMRAAKRGAGFLWALAVLESVLLSPVQAAANGSISLTTLAAGDWVSAAARGARLTYRSRCLGQGRAAVRVMDATAAGELRRLVEATLYDLFGDAAGDAPAD